jgi:hypothetical protein
MFAMPRRLTVTRPGRKWWAGGLCLLATVSTLAGPLEDFEPIVLRCKTAYDARPSSEVVFVEPLKAWVKRIHAPAVVKYDVRRTDSLVSPYSAMIEVATGLVADRAETEEAARALNPDGSNTAIRVTARLNFAYRGTSWEFVEGTRRAEIATRSSPPPMVDTTRHSRATVMKDAFLRSCI